MYINIKLKIAKEAAEIYLNDMTGMLTINAAIKKANKNPDQSVQSSISKQSNTFYHIEVLNKIEI